MRTMTHDDNDDDHHHDADRFRLRMICWSAIFFATLSLTPGGLGLVAFGLGPAAEEIAA